MTERDYKASTTIFDTSRDMQPQNTQGSIKAEKNTSNEQIVNLEVEGRISNYEFALKKNVIGKPLHEYAIIKAPANQAHKISIDNLSENELREKVGDFHQI